MKQLSKTNTARSVDAQIKELEQKLNGLIENAENQRNARQSELKSKVESLPLQFSEFGITTVDGVIELLRNNMKVKASKKPRIGDLVRFQIEADLKTNSMINVDIAKKYNVSPASVQLIKEKLGLVKKHSKKHAIAA